jgi:hypothetical protein
MPHENGASISVVGNPDWTRTELRNADRTHTETHNFDRTQTETRDFDRTHTETRNFDRTQTDARDFDRTQTDARDFDRAFTKQRNPDRTPTKWGAIRFPETGSFARLFRGLTPTDGAGIRQGPSGLPGRARPILELQVWSLMPKKSTDPFMGGLWEALIADRLGPGGNETGWDETNVRIRNRFIKAVRQVLQSGAAFGASTMELPAPKKSAAPAGKPAKGKRRDDRELQLPLMSSIGKAKRK